MDHIVLVKDPHPTGEEETCWTSSRFNLIYFILSLTWAVQRDKFSPEHCTAVQNWCFTSYNIEKDQNTNQWCGSYQTELKPSLTWVVRVQSQTQLKSFPWKVNGCWSCLEGWMNWYFTNLGIASRWTIRL